MELSTVRISSDDIMEIISKLINDYILIERTKNGLDYQQESYFKMGQINIVTSLMEEKWDFHKTGQSYYDFLKYLVEKYELTGVFNINQLGEKSRK